jgi:uncharacterized membrane protein
MLDRFLWIFTFVAAIGSGLMAGLFFVFSVTIMTALGRVPSQSGIAVMQSINKVIINPWFFLAFFGTAATCLAVAIASAFVSRSPGTSILVAGSLLYLVGCVAVTMLWNVPLNNELATVDPTSAEGAQVWARYLDLWTKWNHLRTLACLGAAALLTIAIGLRR